MGKMRLWKQLTRRGCQGSEDLGVDGRGGRKSKIHILKYTIYFLFLLTIWTKRLQQQFHLLRENTLLKVECDEGRHRVEEKQLLDIGVRHKVLLSQQQLHILDIWEVAYLVFVETVAQNPDVQTTLEEVLQHRPSCHLVSDMRSFSHREQVSNSDHSAKFERFERGPRGVEGLLCSLVKCHLTIHNEDVVDVNLQRIQAPETQI